MWWHNIGGNKINKHTDNGLGQKGYHFLHDSREGVNRIAGLGFCERSWVTKVKAEAEAEAEGK